MELKDFLVEHLQIQNPVETDEWINSLCPMHSERRKSFGINKESLVYNCYVCGTGPLYKVLMEVNSISKMDALNLIRTKLDKNYNATSSTITADGFMVKKKKQKKVIRGLQDDLRYWKGTHSKYILSRGFEKQYLNLFGVCYDCENRWVMFPVYLKNILIGIMYRNSYAGGDYWYSKGFKKTEFVYNIDNIPRGELVLIVESPIDVIWLEQCGYSNVVAFFGSKYGKGQIEQVRDRTNRIIIGMDNDDEGRRACRKLWYEFKGCVKYKLNMGEYGDFNDMAPDIVINVVKQRKLYLRV